MKKLMIALYAGLAVTVWLLFLPSAEEAKAPTVTLSDRVERAPTTPQKTPQIATANRPNQAASPTDGQAEPMAGSDILPTADASDLTQEPAVRRDVAYREVNVIPQSISGQFQVVRPHMETNDEPTRTRTATSATKRDTQAHVASYNFQAAATFTGADAAPELTPTTSATAVSSKNDRLNSDRLQSDTESTATETAAANTDTGTRTDPGTTTSTTPVSDNTTATGDDNAFLPQADANRMPAGTDTHKPAFQCPTSCYIECTAYEINMLIKQGCPIPNQ